MSTKNSGSLPVVTGASSFSAITTNNINHNNNNDVSLLHRPTEAQLRWAQFHHKRRAQGIKLQIERLWNTPSHVDDVPGSLPEDGATTTEDDMEVSSMTPTNHSRRVPSKQIKRDKPKVSRGRRALLRVSKRIYLRRKEDIEQYGYQNGIFSANPNEDDEDEEDGETARLLESIFTAETNPRKRAHRRRRRHQQLQHQQQQQRQNSNYTRNPQQEEERLQRFEAACQAMMFNLAAPAPQAIPIPTKRWTRTQDPDAAHLQDEYEDLKWGIRKKPTHGGNTTMVLGGNTTIGGGRFQMTPLDRCASWMMHLPGKVASSRTELSPYPFTFQPNSNISDPISLYSNYSSSKSSLIMRPPGRQKFNQLVELVQQQMIQRRGMTGGDEDQKSRPRPVNAPRMRLKYLTTSAAAAAATAGEDKEDMDRRKNSTPNKEEMKSYENYSEDEEYDENDEMTLPTPPRRKAHPMSDRFLKGETTTATVDDSHHKHQKVRRNRHNTYDQEEKKLPETQETEEEEDYDDENDDDDMPPPPRRKEHPMSERFLGDNTAKDDDYYRNNQNKKINRIHHSYDQESKSMTNQGEGGYGNGDKDDDMAPPPRRKAHPMSERFLGDIMATDDHHHTNDDAKKINRIHHNYDKGEKTPYDVNEKYNEGDDNNVTSPPRRKAHPMSEQFVGDTTTRGHDLKPKRTVRKLGISPVGPNESAGASRCCPCCAKPSPVGSTSNESDFFAQVRYGGESQPSPAESDFFAQVRLGTESQPSPAESDVFARVRQGDKLIGRSSSVESDFFAQVRHMNPNDEATARPSRDYADTAGLMCDECRIDCQDDENYNHEDDVHDGNTIRGRHSSMSSMYSSVSPLNASGKEVDNYNHDYDNQSRRLEPQESPRGQAPQDSPQSETSALSGLWNRGRNNLGHAVSSALNAIPEQTVKHLPRISTSTPTKASTPTRSSSPANLKTRAASVSGKVGGFFNMLRGETGGDLEGQDNDDGGGGGGDFDDHVALGNFRKAQNERRESRESNGNHDDSSSVSSFRVLPAGIRSVVQSIYGSAQEANAQAPPSPDRSFATRSSIVTRSSVEELSPDKLKQFHDKVVKNSPLLGDRDQEQSIIDTDETESGVSEDQATGRDLHATLSTLMMSPALLTKRLQQAVRAIEERNWDQVSYLITANPWLAEMPETATKQYLLHKLAYYGTDDAPEDLNQTLLKMFPAAVHKFDRDGNVPLHLAAAAENLEMIVLLGEAFASGASIRNEDGMLPLHFTIASHNGYDPAHDNGDEDDLPSPVQVIKTVLKLFPKAVAIPDNDGNLPLHIAVSSLEGPIGVDVVYLLLDEADRQLQDPYGARFYNKVKMEDLENDTVSTVSTEHETDDSSSIGGGGVVHCNMVRNEKGETPLLTAIRTKNGWEMIEAVACGLGGKKAALTPDVSGNNALHLLVSEEYYCDPAATLSILKVAPEAACKRNARGMLPIEDACMHGLPRELILSLALVDLPMDLDDKDGVKVREGFGGSWWFLTCDCDDQYVDIVQEVISFCTFQQVRELCFLKAISGSGTVLSRATPKCQMALTQALRFVGRFEFIGKSALYTDADIGMKEFDALDFGGTNQGGRPGMADEGRRVLLRCYAFEEPFMREAANLCELDTTFVEEVLAFAVNEFSGQPAEGEGASPDQQFCISIERPSLTLDRVVDGMLRNDAYRRDPELRKKYAGKIFAVLRLIAKSIRHLHVSGVVHGDLCMEQCGKYDDSWKVMGRLNFQRIGEPFEINRWHQSYPPEAIVERNDEQDDTVFNSDDAPVCFDTNLAADPSLDIWAFGKLAYEVLVGDPLFDFDSAKEPSDDFVTMLDVMEWNSEENLKQVFVRLLDTGITEAAADLITTCLFPSPEERPASMDDILAHPAWKEMRRHKERSSRKHRDDGSSIALSSSRGSI